MKTFFAKLAVLSLLALPGMAQAAPANPFGLVYRGAITENIPGKVNPSRSLHPERPQDCRQRLHARRV